MFSQLSTDVSLYILSFLSLPDVLKLHRVSRDIHRFLEDNDTAIYHQLAIAHHFTSPGVSLDDVVECEQVRGGWLDGVRAWKDLCRRWVSIERNWLGLGPMMEGGYLTYGSDVRWFRVDERERTVLAITDASPKRALSVRALEDGRLLWSLSAVNGLDVSNGYLLLWRNNGGIEIWKRANDVVQASASIASPLRQPSPLAATASQLKQSPFTLDAKDRPRDLRGVYLPHGFLPSFTGAPFRITRFKAPWLAAVDVEAAHVVRLYDVEQGILLRCFDLDAIIQDNARGQQPWLSVLFDIDLSSEYLCACFDFAIVVVPLYDNEFIGPSVGNKIPAFVYVEDQGPFEVKQTALQLKKRTDQDLSGTDGGTVLTDKNLSAVKVSGTDALEPHSVVPPSPESTEEESMALVRPSARWTSCFLAARFSPDGRHLIVGTAYSLMYLFPDFARVLRSTANDVDIVQKLNIGEPVRDLLWDVQQHRVVFRTEPGDTFIADLNPRHHFDASSSSYGSVSFDGGRFLRLRDFSSLYGAVFGDMQMRKTGLWFIWDIAQMHEDVRNRVKGQGKTLTYSPRADGRAINMADVNEKAISVCFIDFGNEF